MQIRLFGQYTHTLTDNNDSPSSPVPPGPPSVVSCGHVQPRPDMDTVLVTDAQAHIQCPLGMLRLRQVHAGGGRTRRGGAVQGVHGAGPVHPAQDNPHLQHRRGHGPHRTAVIRPGHHNDRFPFGQGGGLRQEGQVAQGGHAGDRPGPFSGPQEDEGAQGGVLRRHRPDLLLAGGCDAVPGHGQAHRGLAQPGPRHLRRRCPGNRPDRGLDTLHLLVPSRDVHQPDQADEAEHSGGPQRMGQDAEDEGQTQDRPGPQRRAGSGILQEVQAQHPGHHNRRKLPLRRTEGGLGTETRTSAQGRRPRPADPHTEHRHLERRGRRGAEGRLHLEELPQPALVARGSLHTLLQLRPVRLHRPGKRREDTLCTHHEGGAERHKVDPRGEPAVPFEAQRLLPLAQGAEHVPAGVHHRGHQRQRRRRGGGAQEPTVQCDQGVPHPEDKRSHRTSRVSARGPLEARGAGWPSSPPR